VKSIYKTPTKFQMDKSPIKNADEKTPTKIYTDNIQN
jgi:hypothetical protein